MNSKRNERESVRLLRSIGVIVVAAFVSVGLTGCSKDAAAATAQGDATELRLGYFANLTHALPLVGVQDGTYQRDLGSTKLTTQIFNAGPAAVEALFAGAIDAAYVGPNPAINAFTKSNGEAVRIVAGAASGGAQLIVQPTITTAAQPKGQTVASPQLGGTQDVALRFWLKQQGLSAPITGSGDVVVAPQENAQTLDLFKQGKIAGAWVPEPWASRLVVEGGGKVLVDEKSLWPAGSFVTTQLVVSTDYLTAHPQTITKLLQAELDTITEIKSNPTKAKTSANDAIKSLTGKNLATEVLDRAWSNITLTSDPVASTLQTSADHAVAVGTTKQASLNGIYDLVLLNALLEKVGQPKVSAAGLGKE